MNRLRLFLTLLLFSFLNLQTAFADDFLQSDEWQLTLTVSDGNGSSIDLVAGTTESATEAFNSGLDQFAPPPPPNGVFDARIIDGEEDYFKRFKPLTVSTNTWQINARPTNGSNVTFTWDSAEFNSADGFFILTYEENSSTVTIDMRDSDSVTLSGNVEVTLNHAIQQTVSGSYSEGWQLIGYPADGAGINPFDFFSNSITNTAYSFNGVYSEASLLTAGTGYWLRFEETQPFTFEPPFVNSLEVSLNEGWNLISGPYTAVAVSDIVDTAGLIVDGSLQSYSNSSGYTSSTVLEPGRGYWINTTGAGTVTLTANGDALLKRQSSSTDTPEGFAAFSISNEGNQPLIFYLGGSLDSPEKPDLLSYSMPPLPPNGAFDIRFVNDSRLITEVAGTLKLRSPGESLTLTHLDTMDDLLQFVVHRKGSDEPDEYTLSSGEELTIAGSDISEIDVSVEAVNSNEFESQQPESISLSQNYPNPFNPTTIISYQLPNAGSVQLELFDMTGQRIAVLKEGMQSAGSHTVEFDASSLSSGVYIYRLQTAGSVLTRKMTLIK